MQPGQGEEVYLTQNSLLKVGGGQSQGHGTPDWISEINARDL